ISAPHRLGRHRNGSRHVPVLPCAANHFVAPVPEKSPRRTASVATAMVRGTRQDRNAPRTISAATEAVRRGDFSGTGATIYDPLTGNADGSGRTAFPGNIIPRDRISPVAKKLIPYFPLPNLSGDFNNYFVQPRFLFNRWT